MPTDSITLKQLATEDFFTLIGMETMSEKDKDAILEKMNTTVHARVYLQISEELTMDERKEMDTGSAEGIIPFLQQKGFDLATMLYEESMRYRYELASAFKIATTPQ